MMPHTINRLVVIAFVALLSLGSVGSFAEPAPTSVTPVLLASGLSQPLYVTDADDGTDRLFIVERHGTIRVWEGGLGASPFLDITSRVGSGGQEQGLLGLAFEPDYENSGRFYVYYTDPSGGSVMSRFQVSQDPDAADAGSEEVLLTQSQPFANHNGGMLDFGPDGYLYVALGDGGLAADPLLNAQNPTNLLGAMLRLDVSTATGYQIPPDNPYAGVPGVREEIWATGLRNPWRFSFDAGTGDLYIADVGQFDIEEVNVQPSTMGGQNYGWPVFEGHGVHSSGVAVPALPAGFTFPVYEYTHAEGCSVTGGYVYRGSERLDLVGSYLFSDFCSGALWALDPVTLTRTTLAQTTFAVASFGEDADGELYVVDLLGAVYRLT